MIYIGDSEYKYVQNMDTHIDKVGVGIFQRTLKKWEILEGGLEWRMSLFQRTYGMCLKARIIRLDVCTTTVAYVDTIYPSYV